MDWEINEQITQYQIYQVNKGEEGENRLAEVVWHGLEVPAVIYGLEPDTRYKFALVGFIENGETNTQEFQIKTRLETPQINWENSKVGWTSAVLEWSRVARAQGYQLG